MWRAERLRLFVRNARGGQLRESAPVASQVDEDGVAEENLSPLLSPPLSLSREEEFDEDLAAEQAGASSEVRES